MLIKCAVSVASQTLTSSKYDRQLLLVNTVMVARAVGDRYDLPKAQPHICFTSHYVQLRSR